MGYALLSRCWQNDCGVSTRSFELDLLYDTDIRRMIVNSNGVTS
jgi:hypothetical protein